MATLDPAVPSTSKAGSKLNEMMLELRKCQWYYGAISSRKAERLLRDRPPGHFLLRDSRSECYLFTISYQAPEGLFHTRVQYHNGRFCLGGPNALLWAESLVDFVAKTVDTSKHSEAFDILMHSNNRIEASANVHLLYPVQRKDFLPSLKYLCRVQVRHSTRDERLVRLLPLPAPLKKYVSSSNYLYPL